MSQSKLLKSFSLFILLTLCVVEGGYAEAGAKVLRYQNLMTSLGKEMAADFQSEFNIYEVQGELSKKIDQGMDPGVSVQQGKEGVSVQWDFSFPDFPVHEMKARWVLFYDTFQSFQQRSLFQV